MILLWLFLGSCVLAGVMTIVAFNGIEEDEESD